MILVESSGSIFSESSSESSSSKIPLFPCTCARFAESPAGEKPNPEISSGGAKPSNDDMFLGEATCIFLSDKE